MAYALSYPLTCHLNTNRYGIPQGTVGRNGLPLVGICLHDLGMPLSTYISYLASPLKHRPMNPTSCEHPSVHYAVGLDGAIHQFIEPYNVAWGLQGLYRPTWPLVSQYLGADLDCLLIHVGLAAFGSQPSNMLFQATAQLLAFLATTHQLTVDYQHVISHAEIDASYEGCARALLPNLVETAQYLASHTGGEQSVLTRLEALEARVRELEAK